MISGSCEINFASKSIIFLRNWVDGKFCQNNFSMKPLFILLATHFFILLFWKYTDNNIVRTESDSTGWITEKFEPVDSLQTIRLINTSSLKGLPGVISDL